MHVAIHDDDPETHTFPSHATPPPSQQTLFRLMALEWPFFGSNPDARCLLGFYAALCRLLACISLTARHFRLDQPSSRSVSEGCSQSYQYGRHSSVEACTSIAPTIASTSLADMADDMSA